MSSGEFTTELPLDLWWDERDRLIAVGEADDIGNPKHRELFEWLEKSLDPQDDTLLVRVTVTWRQTAPSRDEPGFCEDDREIYQVLTERTIAKTEHTQTQEEHHLVWLCAPDAAKEVLQELVENADIDYDRTEPDPEEE